MEKSEPPRPRAAAVRPTKRALSDLGIEIPTIDNLLHELQDPHVLGCQKLPRFVDSGGAERVRALSDRVWLKYKSRDTRAVCTQLTEPEVESSPQETLPEWIGRWWIGAAGRRADDSKQRDFYAQVEIECAKGSSHLLPGSWDWNRLRAELAVVIARNIKTVVIDLIALSLQTGKTAHGEAQNHYIAAQVSSVDGEAYLVLGTGGVYDPKIVAIILASVPGISNEDWGPEPDPERFGASPQSGEVVFSTLMSERVQHQVLELSSVSDVL